MLVLYVILPCPVIQCPRALKPVKPKEGYKKTPGAIDTTSLGVHGADSQIRTGDLILTKDALYRLSYISTLSCDNGRILSYRQ